MTPKEKAKKLVYKYWDIENIDFINSIECALIAVDEILNSNPSYYDYGGDGWKIIDNTEYWQEVKQEIEKL